MRLNQDTQRPVTVPGATDRTTTGGTIMTNATQTTVNDIVELLRKREWTDIADGIERGEAAWYTDDDETTVTAAYDYAIHKIDAWSAPGTERYLSDARSVMIHNWTEAEAADHLDWWITEYESVMAYEAAMETATDEQIAKAVQTLNLNPRGSTYCQSGDSDERCMREAVQDYATGHGDFLDYEDMQTRRAAIIAEFDRTAMVYDEPAS